MSLRAVSKYWPLLIVLVYGLVLVLLTVPIILASGFNWFADPAANQSGWTWGAFNQHLDSHFGISLEEAVQTYQTGPYWIWLTILLGAQAILLFVPVTLSRQRNQPRRGLLLPIWTSAFLLGNLCLAGVFCLMAAFLGDSAFEVFEAPGEWLEPAFQSFPVLSQFMRRTGTTPGLDFLTMATILATAIIFWLIWGMIFYNHAKEDVPDRLIQRAVRWLIRGSILELLIAVPCHILVRHRNDCCAPYGTFWGITMGVSVMLLAFGPGVLFLYQQRLRQKSTGRLATAETAATGGD